MARKKAVNRVVSIWHGSHNVGVVSTTDDDFLEHLKEWAKRKGYTIKEGLEEHET
jgi:hypothetical protein